LLLGFAGGILLTAADPLPGDGAPAPSNARGQEYPKIHNDLRVTFRIKAPEAKKVQVLPKGSNNGLGNTLYDLKMDTNGIWSVTTPPVQPGFHYYELVIDNFHCNDPASETFFGWNKPTSGLEVPDPNLDFYAAKPAPHGEVRALFYHSKVTGALRRAFVYTPPNYETFTRLTFPVLYLQHGAGESERAWSVQGRVNFILDNLIAANKAKPMIVVMDNGYATQAGVTNDARPRGTESFSAVVINDLIPLVDKTYRTIPVRHSRAIAGLSMGAGQALQIGLANQDKFAWIGAFSGGFRDFNPSESYGGALSDATRINKSLRLLWLGMGQADEGFDRMKTAHLVLEASGVKHLWCEVSDSHEWQAWRKHIYEFAQKLF
jgi:enterochelin esterase family protein